MSALNVTTPKVSIGMPVFNGEIFIKRALESLLKQDFLDHELIISDNASTDRTSEICREYSQKDARIQYCRNDRNIGAINNFNAVLQLARGDYFMWAACDNIWERGFVKACVAELDKDYHAVLCYADVKVVDEEGVVIEYWRKSLAGHGLSEGARFQSVFLNRTLPVYGLMRTCTLRQNGLAVHDSGTDRFLLAEMARLGHFVRVPELLFTFSWKDSKYYKTKVARSYLGGDISWKPASSVRALREYARIVGKLQLPIGRRIAILAWVAAKGGVRRLTRSY